MRDSTTTRLAAWPEQPELARRTLRHAPVDGVHESAVPGLHFMRASEPMSKLIALYEPALCIVVQGSKEALVDGEVFSYDPMHYLIVSVTLPAVGRIVDASPEQPYLCIRLDIDRRELADLILGMGAPTGGDRGAMLRGIGVAPMEEDLSDALLRLVRLLDTPRDIRVLAPLLRREVLYRVLTGSLGPQLRAQLVADGQGERIDRVLRVLRERFAERFTIGELAEIAHMSESALHRHFKAVTAMSPLQYQKTLRLHEARRLMLGSHIEAAAAAHRVGYESASQFSREYRRLFGAPPMREVGDVRAASVGAPG